MYKVLDIAKKLIKLADEDEVEGSEALSGIRLQKLLYYEQGYHLAVFGEPLFDDEFIASIHGPSVVAIFNYYYEIYNRSLPIPKKVVRLSDDEELLFIRVYYLMRDLSASGLMRKACNESPWKNTPQDCVISNDSMRKFFRTQLKQVR